MKIETTIALDEEREIFAVVLADYQCSAGYRSTYEEPGCADEYCLKDVELVVVYNKHWDLTAERLEELGLYDFFEELVDYDCYELCGSDYV